MSRKRDLPDYRRDPAAPIEASPAELLAVEPCDHEDGTSRLLLWLDTGGSEASRVVLSAECGRRLLEGLRALDQISSD